MDFGFLGDTVHLVPALRELRRHYASAELHVLSASVGAELLGMVPCVDRAWAFPLTNPSPPPWKHREILRALRRERFDVAISFNGNDRPLFTSALTGAPWRAAHDEGRPHFWRRWLIRHWVPPQSRLIPTFERHRQVLARLGFPLEPPRFDLSLPEEARRWAAELTPAPLLHISVNASTPLTEWPLESWAALTRRLLGDDPDLVVVATASANPREQERLASLAAVLVDPRFVVPRETVSLPRLAALLSRSVCHVGGSSGALHLALAVGAQTFSLFRDDEGLGEWSPRGPAHVTLAEPCSCRSSRRPDPGCLATPRCLARISPETVAARLSEHLRRLPG